MNGRGGDAVEVPRPFGRLLDHLEWANRRALEATGATDDPEPIRLLSHILAAERVWLQRLDTGDSSGLEIWPELSRRECESLVVRNVEGYRHRLSELDGGKLDREVTYRNSAGRKFDTPVREIVHHVLLHGSHHRGQIAMCLRDAGCEPVNTDFVTFVRERARGQPP